MKKILLAFVGLGLVACGEVKEIPVVVRGDPFQEILVELTEEEIIRPNVTAKLRELRNDGVEFWSDRGKVIRGGERVPEISRADGIYGEWMALYKGDDRYSYEENREIVRKRKENGYLVLPEGLPAILDDENANIVRLYKKGDDYYSILGKRKYWVYRNDEAIFSSEMESSRADPVPIRDFKLFDGKLAFTYQKRIEEGRPAKEGSLSMEGVKMEDNVYFKNETMNEKYDLENSHYPFMYAGKFGFLGNRKGKKERIFFAGNAVSPEFDKLRVNACCSYTSFPFEIHGDGILFTMVEKGGKHFFWEINLEEVMAEMEK